MDSDYRFTPEAGRMSMRARGAGMVTGQTAVYELFRLIVAARDSNQFIRRESRQDKEFHFQNWVKDRLAETGLHFEQRGRNTYPDFSMVELTEGYEIKGLAYPGRDSTFDSNSQVPTGYHNGRAIYYVFGRYPRDPDGDEYPVTDLVLCHGDFLNANHEYKHKNKSVRGFGTYGDIMIRDRKMYVVPTPFALATNVAHYFTLIMPSEATPPEPFEAVGNLVRTEAAELVVAYTFDLRTNDLVPEKIPNPGAGRTHHFKAWRLAGEAGTRRVELVPKPVVLSLLVETEADDADAG
jgi:hypothetical protein